MRKYLLNFILFLWASYGYSAALAPEEPLQMNGFNIPIKVSPSMILAVLETSRDETELSDTSTFEERSLHIGPVCRLRPFWDNISSLFHFEVVTPCIFIYHSP